MNSIIEMGGHQILSDGKSLAIIWREGNKDAAIFLSEYMVSQSIVNVQQDIAEINCPGQEWREYVPGLRSIEVELSLRSLGECEYKTGKDLMLEMDLFSRMSVIDLFKVINKKLNQR